MATAGTVNVPLYAKINDKEIYVGTVVYDVVAESRDGKVTIRWTNGRYDGQAQERREP